ncbi:hypothetical protein J6590_050335 [Homalodisca vitripennis]|nr:hypothetical protein J6590_050335 [Homalodisca vitripennis]
MEMEQDPFDTESFIDEIEKRRALWDLESPDYKNRVLKRSAWEEVVDIFSKTESTVEEKKQLDMLPLPLPYRQCTSCRPPVLPLIRPPNVYEAIFLSRGVSRDTSRSSNGIEAGGVLLVKRHLKPPLVCDDHEEQAPLPLEEQDNLYNIARLLCSISSVRPVGCRPNIPITHNKLLVNSPLSGKSISSDLQLERWSGE